MTTMRTIAAVAFPLLLIVIAFGFAQYSIERGLSLGQPGEILFSRLYHEGSAYSNLAIYGHMVLGGLLTVLAPLQLIGPVRRRRPAVHRATGYLVSGLALLTAAGGAVYMAFQGTIGGPIMTLGFGVYGALLAIAAFQTVRFARQRDARHRDWALRLIVLALGSWLYRVHYAIWSITTGGLWTQPDFSGGFDRLQVFAFYVPYLVLLEIWLRSTANRPNVFAAGKVNPA